MLVLTRKPGERIVIGDDIVITVLDTRGDGVRIGIDAPKGVRIHRDEIIRAVSEANLAAAQTAPDAEERIKAALGFAPSQPASVPPASAPGPPAPVPGPPASAP